LNCVRRRIRRCAFTVEAPLLTTPSFPRADSLFTACQTESSAPRFVTKQYSFVPRAPRLRNRLRRLVRELKGDRSKSRWHISSISVVTLLAPAGATRFFERRWRHNLRSVAHCPPDSAHGRKRLAARPRSPCQRASSSGVPAGLSPIERFFPSEEASSAVPYYQGSQILVWPSGTPPPLTTPQNLVPPSSGLEAF